MVTLNFAMMAMMIGANILPMHTENMYIPTTYSTAQIEIVDVGIINKDVISAAPMVKKEAFSGINRNKTYEQCMKEAFERIYEEVNRMLDQIPEKCEEQFQLQRMMQ